jgi:uncharacterized membrane protein YfbV (UPF0208 family)
VTEQIRNHYNNHYIFNKNLFFIGLNQYCFSGDFRMSNLSSTMRDGQAYLKRWPRQKVLASLFPEHKVIAALELANKTMPALAIITICLPYLGGQTDLVPQAAFFALFFLAAPFHGIYWLGIRANTVLPPGLASWYRQLHRKLTDAGESLKPAEANPRYYELADTLGKAFRRFDKGFVVYGE